MDAKGNNNLNLQNKLSDSIPDDENEELRWLGTMRTDANFNGLHEEFSAAAGFHHSQFPDAPLSSHPNFAGSFSDSISYADIDWSFDGSRLGLSSQNWSNSILTNAKSTTNAPFHVRTPEVPTICRVPMRHQAAEGLHIIGRDRETNNHNLQSSGCGETIDLNITAIRSGFQPHSLDKLDSETLKATTALNKEDKISCFKDNTGDLPNISTFSENSVGVRCSNFINFSLHPSSVFQPSIVVGEESPFPRPRNEDDLNAAIGQSNEDIPNSLKLAASSRTASSNSQIGLSSRSWLTDFEPCVLRRDQNQQPSEQQSYIDARNCSSECSTFAPSLGIFATISVPDRSFELHQSADHPSRAPQNVGNAPTSGNQNAGEFGTVEDSGLTESHSNSVTPVSNPTCSNSSPSLPKSFHAQISQVLPVSASPAISSHVSSRTQMTEIDPYLQTQEQISQPIICDYVPPIPSNFEDLRVRSLQRPRSSHCYIKCQDLDQTPELSGQRCFLCKRDLSFKPEGSFVLPKILPAVAVLPCRHVFHDLCLERITPQDQSEDPPCIPCAVGET